MKENNEAFTYTKYERMSEDGKMTVIRLSEQNGTRGKIKLNQKVKNLNMLEDILSETDVIEFRPFEIITIGM